MKDSRTLHSKLINQSPLYIYTHTYVINKIVYKNQENHAHGHQENKYYKDEKFQPRLPQNSQLGNMGIAPYQSTKR